MKRKGFTLVELLAVIVIMGIIIGISIPAVTAVQKRMVKGRMETFYKIVEESTDAYIEQYSKDFDVEEDCFEIPYDELIKEELLKEDDITCLSEGYGEVEGTIIARRVNEGNTYKYEYNLTCYDKKTNKKLTSAKVDTNNCIGVNGGYTIEVHPVLIDKNGNESEYTGEWTSGKVRYDVEVYNPYFYELKSIQYQEKNKYEWKEVNSEITDSSVNGKGYILFETDNYIDTSIKIRTVDINNNISGEKGYYNVKLDNESPTCSLKEDSTSNRANGVNISIVCSDNGSGCSIENQTTDKNVKNKNISYKIKDNAGNSNICAGIVRSDTYYRYETKNCAVYKSCSAAGCNKYPTCEAAGCKTKASNYSGSERVYGQERAETRVKYYNSKNYYPIKMEPLGNNYYLVSYTPCATYNQGSVCGNCLEYKSGAVCGCNTWGSGKGDWTSWSTSVCPTGDQYNCVSQTWYFLN